MRYPRVSSLDAALHETRVSFGAVAYPPAGTFGPRRQGSVQLVFVHDGSAHVSVGETELAVSSGYACLLLPGNVEHFRFSTVRETRHSWVHYWSAADDVRLLDRLRPTARVQRMSPTLVRLLERLLAEPAVPDALRTLRAYEILYRYVFDAEHRESTRRSLALEAALTFVEQHLEQPIDVAQIATASAVSRPHLFRLFREQLGLTPSQYVWERRVGRALELLRETGLPVADVALLSGFRNPKHLARRVRAATGTSPVGVRAQALQPDRN